MTSNKPRLLIFAGSFAVIGYLILSLSSAAPPSAHIDKNQPPASARVLAASNELQAGDYALGQADKRHDTKRKNEIKKSLSAVADKRLADLKALFKSSPPDARRGFLADDYIKSLTSKGIAVEKMITLNGKYGYRQYEDDETDRVDPQIVMPSGKRYSLFTEQRLPDINTGSDVTVSGYLIGDELLIGLAPGSSEFTTAGEYAPITVDQAAGQTSDIGPMTLAVIVVNFNGQAPIDMAKVRAAYQGNPDHDAASFVSQSSYGQATLAAEFFGPYNSNNSCSAAGYPYNEYINAANPDITFSNYQRLAFVSACGGGSALGYATLSTPQGTIQLKAETLVGNPYQVTAHVHELAHTLGSNKHGSFYACGLEVFVPPNNLENESCYDSEYRDPYDILGQPPSGFVDNNLGDLSPAHKSKEGWLDSVRYPTITSSGTYTLSSYESGNGVVALKIPRGNSGSYFTLEYRQPIGIDSYIGQTSNSCQDCNAAQGALLRLAGITLWGQGGGSDSHLIDNTPGSKPGSSSIPDYDVRDGALLPGKTFTDPEYNISIKTISVTSSTLTAQVTFGGGVCTHKTPTVSAPSPASQAATAGQSRTYTYSVTNVDTAGCPASKFRFIPDPNNRNSIFNGNPAGAVDFGASPDLFSLAPGTSKLVTVTASSTDLAPDGNYQNSPTVIPESLEAQSVSPSKISYQVSSAADTTLPSPPTNFRVEILGSKAVKLLWNASSDNIAVAGYDLLGVGQGFNNVNDITETSRIIPFLSPSTTYNFTLKAYDKKLNFSPPATVSFTTPATSDTKGPYGDFLLSASATDHAVSLQWSTAVDDKGIAFYDTAPCYTRTCYRPGAGQTSLNSEKWLMSDFQAYSLLYAYDGDGNFSLSNPGLINPYTPVNGDPASPSQPQNLYVSSFITSPDNQNNQIVLNWQPSTDNDAISGYYVYYGVLRTKFVTGTIYTYHGPGTPTFKVQAIDTQGSRSADSNTFMSPGCISSLANEFSPPSSAITFPANNSVVSGAINLQSQNSDNSSIKEVKYYLDGKLIGNIYSSPFALSLNTTQISDGQHWLVSEAVDNSCNAGSAGPVSFTVNNSGSPDPLPGDINKDGHVNIIDLSALLSNWGTSNAASDINHDGQVNIFDLSILLTHYGS